MQRGASGPFSRVRIICSISKLTIAAGSAPSPRYGTFINMGTSMPGLVTRQMVAMPPLCTRSSTWKPSISVAGVIKGLTMSDALEQPFGQEGRQALGADRSRGGSDVVRRAAEGDVLLDRVEQRPGCGGIAIAWLPDSPEHNEPATAWQGRGGHTRGRRAGRRLARRRD